MSLQVRSKAASTAGWFAVLLACAAAVHVAVWTVTAVIQLAHGLPFWDAWTIQEDLRELSSDAYDGGTLIRQHNEHRIAMPRLVFLVDVQLFDGRGHFCRFVTLVLAMLTGWGLSKIVGRSLPRGMRWLMFAVIGCASFSSTQLINFIWEFQVQFIGVLTATVWSIYFATRVQTETRHVQIVPYVMSLLCAVFATFTMGHGFVTFLMVLCVWWVAKVRWFVLLGGILVAGASSYVFFDGWASPPMVAAESMGIVGRVAHSTWFALAFLGNPLWPTGTLIPPLFGVVSAVVAATLIIGWWRKGALWGEDEVSRTRRGLVGLMGFVLVAAAMVGRSRAGFSIVDILNSRYGSPALLFWVALLGGFALWVLHGANRMSPMVRRGLVGASALLVVGFLWGTQADGIRRFGHWTHSLRGAESALLSGVDDIELIRKVYEDTPYVLSGADVLRRERLSVFASGTHYLIGAKLNEVFLAVPPEQQTAHGGVEVTTVVGELRRGLRIEGWVALPDGTQADWIFVMAKDGRIVGFGRTCKERPDVVQSLEHVTALRTGFISHTRCEIEDGPLTLWAVDDDWSKVHLIPSLVEIPPEIKPGG